MIPCLIIGKIDTINVLSSYIEVSNSLLLLQGTSTSYQEGLKLISSCKLGIVFMDVELTDQCHLELKRLRQNCCLIIVSDDSLDLNVYRNLAFGNLRRPLFFQQFIGSIRKYGDFLSFLINQSKSELELSSDSVIVYDKNNNDTLIKYSDLLYIMAMDNYVKLYHVNGNLYTEKKTMTGLLKKLPGDFFSRLHRSYIVNDHHVDFIKGDKVYLNDEHKTKIPIGDKYRVSFLHKEYVREIKLRRQRRSIM